MKMTVPYSFEIEESQNYINEKLRNDLLSKRQIFFSKWEENEEKILLNKGNKKELDLLISKQEEEAENLKIQKQLYENELQNSNTIKEDLKNEIDEMRRLNKDLKLKLHEITQKHEKQKMELKSTWNAIKKACNIYKKNLDIHIKMDKLENVELQITFFINENPEKDNYYVTLVKRNNMWNVKNTVPQLSLEHQKELDYLPCDMKDFHVTILLCKLREIFLQLKKSS